MIDAETNELRLAKIARVSACFYLIPPGTVPLNLAPSGRMEDNVLGLCINGIVQGITNLVHSQGI